MGGAERGGAYVQRSFFPLLSLSFFTAPLSPVLFTREISICESSPFGLV